MVLFFLFLLYSTSNLSNSSWLFVKSISLLRNCPNGYLGSFLLVHGKDGETILNGFGKRSSLEDYRLTNRGGKGVKTISITEKTGKLVTLKSVSDNDDLMIINKSGIAIRMQVEDLRVMGRATQGVKVISIKEGDSIAAVAKVMKDEEEIEDLGDIEFTGDTVE